MSVFALLDDRAATNAAPSSRLYEGFEREHRCADPSQLDAMWAQVEADQRAGLHAVLLADYEWGTKLLKAGAKPGDESALRVLMFRACRRLSRDAVDAWLAEMDTSGAHDVAGVMNLQPSVDRAEFTRAIDRIHEAIRAGETYQVNYTYRLHGAAFGAPIALYRKLRARQPVDYGAFIALPAGSAGSACTAHVLSLSPELFLRHEAGLLTARPMKGTAARVPAPESDSESARLLAIDTKNRAENLMIVDLLRNDLGRLAQTGSVRVPALFAIEPYATVFQMTSTVQGQIRPAVGMPELLRAVFPCGSITGAPKHHTMQIIAGLERTPRGLYCGAIGWIDAPDANASAGCARIGDFCFSVAIRTLELEAPAGGLHGLRLGVGAGIVIDSRADDEFDECRLKARFLTGLDPGFELFETMLWHPGEGVRHLDRHLARLAHSAQVLGFAFDRQAVLARLDGFERDAPVVQRVRLALAHDGRLGLTHAPLAALPAGPVRLLLGDDTLPERDPLAAHKTTRRRHYDDGVRAAESVGAFDTLFFDRAGRLVEGGRSNVFVRLDGRWWTPPVGDGALPGVMRGVLLDDRVWDARERGLTRADLARAEGIVVCNALRGVLPAEVATDLGVSPPQVTA